MGNYLIKRISEHGWVSEFGAERYTRYLDWARLFKTRPEAETEVRDGEAVIDTDEMLVQEAPAWPSSQSSAK